MRISPAITLGLSVSFGIAAIFAARHFTTKNDEPEIVETISAPVEVMVPVVVALDDIGRGEIVDGVNLVVEHWPSDEAPFGRFASVAAVGSDQYSSRQAMTEIAAGEPVLDSRLSPAGMRPSLAGRLEPGFRAYTVSMNDISGVAGFVLPGDRVDILHTKTTENRGGAKSATVRVLLTNVEILGVGLNDDIRTDQPAEFHNATLAVSLEGAQKLSAATESGRLSLALRGTRDQEVVSVLAEAKPARRPRPRRVVKAAPKTPAFGTVQVVLGQAKQDYTVPVNAPPQQ